MIGKRGSNAQAACPLIITPHLGKAAGNAHVHGLITQLQVQFAILAGHTPSDTVGTDVLRRPYGALVGDAGSAAGLDEAHDDVMPLGVHEMGIEQARRARHRQDEAVGLDNLMVDTMHIVAVAGIGRQVFERIVVIDEGHRIAFETVVPDEAFILECAETVATTVIESLTDLLLQGEVKCGTLETALVIHTLNPRHDITGGTPEFTHRERRTNLGIIVSEVFRLKATCVIVAETDITQLIFQVAQVGKHLLLRSGIVVVNVTGPWSLAGITAAVIVATTQSTLIIAAQVNAFAVLVPFPLYAVGLACCGTDDVDLIDKVGSKFLPTPGAQSTLVVSDHILHGTCSCSLVGTNQVDQFTLGTEVALGFPCRAVDYIGLSTVMVKVEHGNKAHAIRVVDDITPSGAHPRTVMPGTPGFAFGGENSLVRAHGGTALRQPQQVDIRSDIVLLVQQLDPVSDGYIPLIIFAPSSTIHGGHRLV